MSTEPDTDGTQAALDLFDLEGVRDLELFSEFVDVMRRHHRGRENAIPSAYLSRLLFGHPNAKSTIRDWKQVALHQLGLPIAYQRGAGYYVVETEAELEDVLDYYYKRITSMKDSARAYEQAVTGSHTRRVYPDE